MEFGLITVDSTDPRYVRIIILLGPLLTLIFVLFIISVVRCQRKRQPKSSPKIVLLINLSLLILIFVWSLAVLRYHYTVTEPWVRLYQAEYPKDAYIRQVTNRMYLWYLSVTVLPIVLGSTSTLLWRRIATKR